MFGEDRLDIRSSLGTGFLKGKLEGHVEGESYWNTLASKYAVNRALRP